MSLYKVDTTFSYMISSSDVQTIVLVSLSTTAIRTMVELYAWRYSTCLQDRILDNNRVFTVYLPCIVVLHYTTMTELVGLATSCHP